MIAAISEKFWHDEALSIEAKFVALYLLDQTTTGVDPDDISLGVFKSASAALSAIDASSPKIRARRK